MATESASAWRTNTRVCHTPRDLVFCRHRARCNGALVGDLSSAAMTRLILSSTYRIGPFEVEPALIEHKAVLEAADVGKPDADRDQIVTVYAVLVEGAVPSGDLEVGLQKHVKRTTAPYKYQREAHFVSGLPKTVSAKIRRVELRTSAPP